MGQSTDEDKAGLHSFGMKFTAIERKTNRKRCDSVCRHLPAAIIMKAVPSSSDSNYRLHSCRPLMLNTMGQSTNKDRAGLHLFGIKYTQEKARENDLEP
jgi:hypothetical protein